MKKIILLMVLSVFLGGCAYPRVWHRTDSDTPTTEKEVQTALSECKQTNDVATAHRHASTWRNICIGTIWIAYGFCYMSDAMGDIYITSLISCMQKADFNFASYRTDRFRWDVLSDFDISMEGWEKQKKK